MDSIKSSIGSFVLFNSTSRLAEIANIWLKKPIIEILPITFPPLFLKHHTSLLQLLCWMVMVAIRFQSVFQTNSIALGMMAAHYQDAAWLADARARIDTERARISNGIQELKNISQRSLAAIKRELDFYHKIKSSHDFEVIF